MLASAKATLVNLIPPAMVAVFLLFWAYGPKALLANPWTLVVCSSLVTIIVLGLEFVFERHEGWRLNKREFFTDLYYVVLSSTVIAWMTQTFAEAPLQAVKTSLGIHTPWVGHLPWLVQVVMAVSIIEFGQYWMHRLMHNVTPFWLTHAPHHHITQLNAAKGAVGNPIELFLITLSVLTFFEFDQTALFACFNTTAVISTFAHANVKSNPPIWYSFFFTTIRHHSLHHSTDYESTRCNYGNSMILFDRIFGTFKEGESVLVGQDERRRLSIWEQTIFPFQPLIARYKAGRAASAQVANEAGGAAAA
ncbi:sterol desaturase family protein [Novosphingobium olei]|uniref:sterol desaturase family protein n=1 Tax=Novosphingobium olei TaxID=2728851 RepID=UPI0030885984|nr:sterol desaturase family protein [Novosphingobium olei]